MLKDYWFCYESDEGEVEFFVECETYEEAWKIAKENFPTGEDVGSLCLMSVITPEEAEIIGLDTF